MTVLTSCATRHLRAGGSSKLQMPRITVPALLLSVALISGCKSVPQPPSPQTGSSDRHPAGEDEYNRGYQAEAHHRHRHGRRDEVFNGNDNWTSYDRTDTVDEPSAPRSSHHHSSRALTSAPGAFDFYLLNLSWSPEFCHGYPGAAECTQHRDFTLHGLWPQNNAGTYPEACSEAPGPDSPSRYADIYPDPTLLQHEWQMHGTCSGLAPDQFFALARRAEQSIHIPAELSNLTRQTTLTPAQLTALLTRSNPAIPASSLAISCGNNYLTAVEVCLDKSLKPGSCSAVKTCKADQIRLPAPQ